MEQMNKRRGRGKDKQKRKPYKSRHFYTVYDNRTDELIILDGTAEQCASMLGIAVSSFRTDVTKFRQGILQKWHIEVRTSDEADDLLL